MAWLVSYQAIYHYYAPVRFPGHADPPADIVELIDEHPLIYFTDLLKEHQKASSGDLDPERLKRQPYIRTTEVSRIYSITDVGMSALVHSCREVWS